MKDTIEGLGYSFTQFCAELIKNNCIISGSFPLLSLHGTFNINKSDIDILGKYDSKHDDIGRQVNSIYPVHPFEKYIYSTNGYDAQAGSPDYDTLDGFNYTRDYWVKDSKPEKKFNFVSTIIDPKVFIKTTFDISCCKVYFDGAALYIVNFDEILNKQGKYNISQRDLELHDCADFFEHGGNTFDYNKYRKFVRNNRLECECPLINNNKDCRRDKCIIIRKMKRIMRSFERIEKYKKYGFTIQVVTK